MPQIDYTRDEVKRQLSRWNLIRDCIAGEERIKEKGTEYLPMPNAHDKSDENKERYRGYKLRASFLNAVDNTVQALLGQVFAADPVVELPPSMELMVEDVDGNGVSLSQRAKKVVAETLALGRACLMVDFPEAFEDETAAPDEQGRRPTRDFTRAEMHDGTARANILQFDPENVINWRTRLVGGKLVLSLVVIAMKYISYDDGFEIKEDDEWRVLRLDESDEYVCDVWRLTSTVTTPGTTNARPASQFVLFRSYKPRDATGAPLKEIPFTFVGSLNNNESPDKPPMYDIACINIAHYRNSADYEDNVYMLGQGTLFINGLSAGWIKDVWKDQPIQLGSRGGVPLPTGADAKILASPENGMVIEAMKSKERHLAMLGAQLVESKEVQRTLGEAQMEKAQIESVLVQVAKNSAAGIQKCLRWAALFYGENAEAVVFELPTDFAINKITPEERKALIADYQGGLLAWEEARNVLRQSGIAYLDDTVARTSIDQEAQTRIDMAAEEAGALHDATGGNDDPPQE